MRDILTFTIDPVDARDFDRRHICKKKLKADLYEISAYSRCKLPRNMYPSSSVLDDDAYQSKLHICCRTGKSARKNIK